MVLSTTPPLTTTPDNEPHVGCAVQVDLYGYVEGDLDAAVTFESHPPTGPVRMLVTDTVFVGEDDNSGGAAKPTWTPRRLLGLGAASVRSGSRRGRYLWL